LGGRFDFGGAILSILVRPFCAVIWVGGRFGFGGAILSILARPFWEAISVLAGPF
jgi:hypothetical protein